MITHSVSRFIALRGRFTAHVSLEICALSGEDGKREKRFGLAVFFRAGDAANAIAAWAWFTGLRQDWLA